MKIINILLVISCLALYGCSLFGLDKEAEVRFSLAPSEFLNQNNISLEAFDGRYLIRLNDQDDFISTNFSTKTDGTLEVIFEIKSADDKILSNGEFELKLREDWRWTVNFQAESADYNPVEGCFGCVEYYSFAINKNEMENSDEQPDSVYVVTGGNFISNPVMY